MRKHGGDAIQLDSGGHGNSKWWQLKITDLNRIASFCNFEHFISGQRAIGNVRLTGCSKHSGDMLCVGPPVMLTVKRMWHTEGVVQTTLQFPTVHFNGKFGHPTYPHMSQGLLKSKRVRQQIISHVRDSLPVKHPLRRKGWCEFPADVTALAAAFAMPDK